MSEQNLINKVTEELKVGLELGYEEEHIAENIIALITMNKEHLDYDHTTQQYNWEKE